MPDSASAEIIVFPITRQSWAAGQIAATTSNGQPAAEPGAAETRLARAIANLDQAVAAQRVAVAAWKSALGELRTVTNRLGVSLRTYHDNLGQLDGKVSGLRAEAEKLETWADGVVASSGIGSGAARN